MSERTEIVCTYERGDTRITLSTAGGSYLVTRIVNGRVDSEGHGDAALAVEQWAGWVTEAEALRARVGEGR